MLDYYCGLSVDDVILKKGTTIKNIEDIEEWLTSQVCPKLTREQIVTFLLSCNNELELVKKTIMSNYTLKFAFPNLFMERHLQDEAITNAIKVIHCCEMPEYFNECIIGVSQLVDTNYRNYNFADYIKLVLMGLESAMFNANPPNGIIIILDAMGFGLMHVTRLRINLLKWFMQYIQEAITVQIKAVHIVNSNFVTEVVFNLTKPFIKNELVKNLHFHSTSHMESFFENYIPKRYLPKDIGGDLESVAFYGQFALEKVKKMEDYFKFEEQQRFNLNGSK
ncbi:hypothetical protein RI129_004292 [Pyrocoelia pectoralis]|uniref:CRAL-TRIO domain-containing protein n=1 Tax=Pyrocoelia pectoralis TaxID=417401 RepID=A0AAN7VIJ8_9COLE